MSEVPSTFHLQPGAIAPDFSLPDGHGTVHSLERLSTGRKAVVIAFVCNHCPFVIHLADAMGDFARENLARGVQVIAINSNDAVNYPDDAPEKMPAFAQRHRWEFPYLHDPDQSVAKAYAAACTPDFYLFDPALKLAYAGQFDESRPGRGDEVTGDDLQAAVDALLEGNSLSKPWQPSSGCNIKWKEGNAPSYFG